MGSTVIGLPARSLASRTNKNSHGKPRCSEYLRPLFATPEQALDFVDCRFASARHHGKQTLRASGLDESQKPATKQASSNEPGCDSKSSLGPRLYARQKMIGNKVPFSLPASRSSSISRPYQPDLFSMNPYITRVLNEAEKKAPPSLYFCRRSPSYSNAWDRLSKKPLKSKLPPFWSASSNRSAKSCFVFAGLMIPEKSTSIAVSESDSTVPSDPTKEGYASTQALIWM